MNMEVNPKCAIMRHYTKMEAITALTEQPDQPKLLPNVSLELKADFDGACDRGDLQAVDFCLLTGEYMYLKTKFFFQRKKKEEATFLGFQLQILLCGMRNQRTMIPTNKKNMLKKRN